LRPSYPYILCILLFSYGCKDRPATPPAAAGPDYKKAKSFYSKQNDSAYFYFNKFATSSKDSFHVAWAYNYMAIIQQDAGDYYGSQESLLASLRYLREETDTDRYCLTADYNELGNNSLKLNNYISAIDYFDQALRFAKDSTSKVIILNGKAVAFKKMTKYDQAISIYETILGQSKKSKREYARVITNLAIVKWMRDSTYRAAPELHTALNIRKEEKDDWGLNSSYAHLADYYLHTRPDSALRYASAMYAVAQHNGSPDDELEALQKLVMLADPVAVKKYFARYQQLNDSLQTARNGAKNQFALIRYETEKNKADNLRLQKENAEEQGEILWQRISIVGGIIVGVWLYSWYRRRARNRLRENNLRLSRKVHDEVANGIYRLMMSLIYRKIGADQTVDELEHLYHKSRDISYDGGGAEDPDLHTAIANLVGSFGAPGVRIGLAGNGPATWVGLGDHIKRELPHILQELMVNMEKHSGATMAAVRFERNATQLVIRYTDDGVGSPEGLRFGNGLTNTENRINGLGGSLTFDRNLPKGLRIEICLPII